MTGPQQRRPGFGFSLLLVVAAAAFSALVASGATLALLAGTRSAAAPGASPIGVPIASAAATTPRPAADASTPASVGSDGVAAVVAEGASPSVVTIASAGTRGITLVGGSGFFAADDLVLTAAHLVSGVTDVTVTLADRRQVAGRVVATDAAANLAVIRVTGTGIRALPAAATGGLTIGQVAIAIGSPLGTFTQSVTKGIVSGIDREFLFGGRGFRGGGVRLTGLIQTDAAISAGSAGGPLLNSSGQVIGVVVSNSDQAQGMGFAIPMGSAAKVLQEAATR